MLAKWECGNECNDRIMAYRYHGSKSLVNICESPLQHDCAHDTIAELQAVFLLETAVCKAMRVDMRIGSEETACLVQV
jgi:hypothetical protein